MTKPTALTYFEKELEMITDVSINAFFYNALAVAPESFHSCEETLALSKKAFYILNGLLDRQGVIGPVREALLGTVLITDLMKGEFKDEMAALHTVAVRPYLRSKDVHKDIQAPIFENIMRAVECHHLDKGASPILSTQPGTAEYQVALAYMIAEMDFLALV